MVEEKTGNEIHTEITDNSPDRSVMTELEFEQSIKDDNKRCQKKWIALDDLIRCIDDTYKDLDMGKSIPIFIQRLKERLGGN